MSITSGYRYNRYTKHIKLIVRSLKQVGATNSQTLHWKAP